MAREGMITEMEHERSGEQFLYIAVLLPAEVYKKMSDSAMAESKDVMEYIRSAIEEKLARSAARAAARAEGG